MFDMPQDVPQYSPIVLVEASQAQQSVSTSSGTIGVCHLIQNPPVPPLTAVNVLAPVEELWNSSTEQERPVGTKDAAMKTAKVSLVQKPKHGELKVEENIYYRYHPAPDYYGLDSATLLVEMGGKKVNVIYSFKIGSSSWGGTEGYDPYEDNKNCPKGRVWKHTYTK